MTDKILYAGEKTRIDTGNLLRGHYEAERLPNDFSPERLVPDFAFNVLNPLGLLYRPVVDEDYISRGGIKPNWPGNKSFAVCLTHDVDIVSLYSFRQTFRRFVSSLRAKNNTITLTREILECSIEFFRTLKYINATDPLHCLDRLLDIEDEFGARSTFFFWPGFDAVSLHHHSDCLYTLSDRVVFYQQECTVAEMIGKIDQEGWEIGLHPSWYSFDNVEEMKRQKAALEKALDRDIVSVRQHYLHYDIRKTPRVQTEAGLKYDSTLGFNDNIGFRFGTCYPWKLYDLENEMELSIIEIPLIIQDGAILNPAKGLRLDEGTAFQYIHLLTESVKDVGGVLTLLWHPHSLTTLESRNFYKSILAHLKEENAWFGTVRQIAAQLLSWRRD